MKDRQRGVWRALSLLWFSGTILCVVLWGLFHERSIVELAPAWLQRASTPIDRFNSGWLDGWELRALSLRILMTRGLLILAFVGIGGAVLRSWEPFRRRVVDFVTCARHPLNLAIFRIVVFWDIYRSTKPEFIKLVTSLPHGLQFPPETGLPRWGLLSSWEHWPVHPIGPWEAEIGATALKAASLSGMLGFFSRTSAFVVAVLFFGVFGALQWYGKVDHGHHLGWFCLIFAVSRCGDALSIDALIQAWRRAGRGITEPPGEARCYGMPLGFCMLLIGLIYFFPGFWKLQRSGLDWVFSDNVIRHFYQKWHIIGINRDASNGWQPLGIDHFPVLYQLGALGVVSFELSFIFLMLWRPTRFIGVFCGLLFHQLNQWMMQGSFRVLRDCYVVFFDWHRILTAIGRRLYRQPMSALYNGASPWCRRMVAYMRMGDLFAVVRWIDARDGGGRGASTAQLQTAAAADTLRAVIGQRTYVGVDAFSAIAWRLPICWPVLPLIYVGSMLFGAHRLRTDRLMRAADAPSETLAVTRSSRSGGQQHGTAGVLVVGTALLVGVAWTGATRRMEGWPLACYPLFDGMVPPQYQTMEVETTDADGTRHRLLPDDYRDRLGYRWNYLLGKIIRQPDAKRRQSQLALVWDVMSERDATLATATRVRFYTVESGLQPQRWHDPPSSRTLVYEFGPGNRNAQN